MSSPLLNPASFKPDGANWAARLIPGSASVSDVHNPDVRKKKRPQSVIPVSDLLSHWTAGSSKAPVRREREAVADAALAFLVPKFLRNRAAGSWFRSVAADLMVVTFNWLLVGALTVPLQAVFPGIRIFEHPLGAPAPHHLLGISLLHGALIILLGCSEGLYGVRSNLGQQTRALGKAVFWATAVLAVAYRLQGAPLRLIAVISGTGLLQFAVLALWRGSSSRAVSSGNDARNVLIVGAGGVGRRVAAYLENHPEDGRTLLGFLDDERPLGNGVLGQLNNLARLARAGFVDEVILAAPHDRQAAQKVLHEARQLRLDVAMVPDLFGCNPSDHETDGASEMPFICLHREHSPSASLLAKRAVDMVGASMALIVLSPLLGVIAALIKLDSPGKVLYAASRAGRKGRAFRCYKFRTMVSNADALKNDLRHHNQRSGPCFKIVRDPRITRLGQILRRYSLDELPQLWNVVRGEMSLVGPRPHPLDDYAGYEVEHLARLDVVPGITGLWQVTARRDPSFQRGMELDREYIRSWSLGLDLRILRQTFMAVVRGSGD